MKSQMGLKFGRIVPGTYELAALERLEVYFHLLYSDLFNTCK